MAHNSDYSQIWAEHNDGVNSWEAAAALRRSTQDWGHLIGDIRYDYDEQEWVRANAINKWARFKPINYDYKVDPLSDAEFEGCYADKQNGIYYGLEIVPGSGLDEHTGTWPAIHNAQYLYHPPTGGAASPYRISDFSSIEAPPQGWDHPLGYDRDARPNPSGIFNGNIGYYTGQLDGIQAGHYPENKLGVDLTTILIDPQTTPEAALALTFPCILVSDAENDLHYFTALDAEDDDKPHPLYYNSAYYRGPWYANFNKTVHGDTTRPFTQAQSGLKMTLFLLRLPTQQYIDSNGYPCLSPGGANLHDYWFDCNDDLLAPSLPIPFPDAINKDLTLRELYNGVRVSADGMGSEYSGGYITGLRFRLSQTQMDPAQTLSWSAAITVDYNGSTATKTITGQTGGFMPAPLFNASDFSDVLYFSPGRTVRVTIVTTVTGTQTTQTTYSEFIIEA